MRIKAIESPSNKRTPIAMSNEQTVALALSGGIVVAAGAIGWAVAKWKGVAIGGALGIASLFIIPAPSNW